MKSRDIKKFRNTYVEYAGVYGKDGLALAVLFDEKDTIKQMGGKWNPAPEGEEGGHWSMGKSQLGDAGLQYLNDHKMIVGPQGELNGEECKAFVEDYNCIQYKVRKPGDDQVYTFSFYADVGLVSFDWPAGGNYGKSLWMDTDNGRAMWDTYMADEYRLITGEAPVEETLQKEKHQTFLLQSCLRQSIMYNVMVTPYKQIHLANMAHVPHPHEINVLGELQDEDLSEFIDEQGGLTGAGQQVLGEMDNNREFI